MGLLSDLQGFDPKPYRQGMKNRAEKGRLETERRATEARDFLPIIREAFLAIDPDLRRLVLFGSLARGIPTSEHFDIDLGVRSDKYLKLVAWSLNQEWKIDVIDLDAVDGSILDGIESQAEIIYEKA